MRLYSTTACLAILLAPAALRSQPDVAGAAAIHLALERLNTGGRAMMIAAHPDDENTALLAWLARGRNVRTAYLSITRGEGGQNLIGSEQGRLLGVIRTQELLAARRIDGAEQYFTSAVDFGFSKSVEETLAKWGHEQTLGEIVYRIREFQPDVIITRFSGTPRDGHGHHQTSAILAKEAFTAAADPKRFPEQLQAVKPWQAKRLVWNVFSFTREQERDAAQPGRIEADLGEYDPVLGYSYSEIAGISRSQHRSQGMGSPERRGSMKNYFQLVAGEPAAKDLFDGVAAKEFPVLRKAVETFDPHHPEKTIPLLLEARATYPKERLSELDETIALCAGMFLDASTDRPFAVSESKIGVTLQAVNRSHVPMEWDGRPLAYNRPESKHEELLVSNRIPGMPTYDFHLRVNGQEITIRRPLWHRYVDKVRGELTRPFAVVRPVSVHLGETSYVFPTGQARTVPVEVRAFASKQSGTVRLVLQQGWTAKPESQPFELASIGQTTTVHFEVTPPAKVSSALIKATATVNGVDTSADVITIAYPHIPTQIVETDASARVVRADVKTLSRSIGYIMGAGDEIPDALVQIGCTVTFLSAEDLAQADLSHFDAIVAGVRAYNTRVDLVANHDRLMEYVKRGGTYVVQYNVAEQGGLTDLGPYPFRVGRDRVTVEDSPVEVLKAGHPLLETPNKITQEDFSGWVQERGLYFASEWNPKYETILASGDPNEKPLAGGMLYARYGSGAYVFTSYSWFRQLPAGVPGAYRIFANLLSAGKSR